ncbi:hypothetical protein ABPG75_005769 [Micractinium tetrahymenae]
MWMQPERARLSKGSNQVDEDEDLRLFRAGGPPEAAAEDSQELDGTAIAAGDSVVHGTWLVPSGSGRGTYCFVEGEAATILESQAVAVAPLTQQRQQQRPRRRRNAAAAAGDPLVWEMSPMSWYALTGVVTARASQQDLLL